MSKLKSKLARRIMAIVLSGAMVMSNMSAYAAELAPETETEVIEAVSETEESENDVADDADNNDGDNDAILSDQKEAETGNSDETKNDTDDTNGVGGDEGTTNPQETVDAPTGLKAEKVSENIQFSWTPVTKDGYNIKYSVSLKEKDATDAQEMLSTTETESTSVDVAATGFTAEKTYTFSVKTVATKTGDDSSGSTPIESDEATVEYTAPKEDGGDVTLSAPTELKAELNDAKDAVTVSWKAVDNAESYEVTAKEQGEGATAEIKKTADNTTSVTFSVNDTDGLSRGKSYKFSVIAKKGSVSSEDAAETENALAIPEDSTNPVEVQTYSLNPADVETAAAGSLVESGDHAARNGEKVGTKKNDAGYFTMWYSAKAKVDTSSKSWSDLNNTPGDDGKIPSINRINFGGKMSVTSDKAENAIEFTTENPASVTIWWAANYAGTDGASKFRNIAIQKKDDSGKGTTVTQTNIGTFTEKNAPYKSTLRLSEAGTYYLGSLVGGNYIFKVEVAESETAVARKEWGEVGNPAITVALKTTTTTDTEGNEVTETDNTTVVVKVTNAVLEDNGGDVLAVTMTKDGETEPLESKKDAVSRTEYAYEFKPTETGKYQFKAELARLNENGEEESPKKESSTVAFDFTMPFLPPANLR